MGVLDAPFRTLAKVLTNTFTENAIVFSVVTTTYNPLTGATITSTQEAAIKSAPPSNWTEEELLEDAARASDLRMIVAQLDLEEAGLSLRPGTESRVAALYNGIHYVAIPVRILVSGDQIAALVLGLRK